MSTTEPGPPEPPEPTEPIPRTERVRAARRRTRRQIGIAAGSLLAVGALAVGAVALLAGDDGDDTKKEKRAATTETTAAASTTAPASTAASDQAACLHGTFRFAAQDYKGPVPTVYGPTELHGGLAGRTIELKPDDTFTFNDDGREQVDFHLISGDVDGTAKLVATAGGTFTPSPTSETGGTVTADVTTLSGSLTLTLDNGQVIDVPLPPDAAVVEETFGITGGATYTCDDTKVVAEFENVHLELERI